MADLHRDQPLFDRTLPIDIIGDYDGGRSNLVFRVLQGNQASAVVGQTERVIHFEITDDRDPYFLYFLDVSESSFPALKRDQGIMVEFLDFPKNIIQLLELCLQSVVGPIVVVDTNTTSPSTFFGGGEAKMAYKATLDTTNGCFSIIEANKFKATVQISLSLCKGNDEAIKSYLASRLSLSLSLLTRQSLQIENLEHRQYTLEGENRRIMEESKEQSTNRLLELQNCRVEHREEMNQTVQLHLDKLSTMQRQYEEELNSLKKNFSEKEQDLQSQLHHTEQQLADSNYQTKSLEFRLTELQRQLSLTETDRQHYLDECGRLNERVREVEVALVEETKKRSDQAQQIASLSAQLAEKEASVLHFTRAHQVYEESKVSHEEKVQYFRQHWQDEQQEVEKLRHVLQSKEEEITKLQGEVNTLKERIKTKNVVIRKEDAIIQELQGKLQTSEKQCNQQAISLDGFRDETNRLKEKLRLSEERIAESNETIAKNTQMINYLVGELEMWQLGENVHATPITPLPSRAPASSTVASSYYTPTSSAANTAPPLPPLRRTAPAVVTPIDHQLPSGLGGSAVSNKLIRPPAVDEVVARYSRVSPSAATVSFNTTNLTTNKSPLDMRINTPSSSAYGSSTATTMVTVPPTTSSTSNKEQTSSLLPLSSKQNFREEFDEIVKKYADLSQENSAQSSSLSSYFMQQDQQGAGGSVGRGREEESSVDINQLSYYNISARDVSPPHKKKLSEVK